MRPEDEFDPQDAQADDTSDTSDDMSLAMIEELADREIRRVWIDGVCYFSVIDVIAILTDSPRPRKYWNALKTSMKDKEGWIETCAKCCPLKMRSPDGKLRETDCADFATLVSLIHTIPALRRHIDRNQDAPSGKCGIYAIVNAITHEQYIGSSIDIDLRFVQHKALLRRGKHHAPSFQEAWDTYGEEAFVLVVLDILASTEQLEEMEQRYIDEERPMYNVASVARNRLSLPPVSEERVQQVLLTLYEIQSSTTDTPLFRVLREAIIYGIVKPGPQFAILVQAEASGVDTWEALGAFIQQRRQAC